MIHQEVIRKFYTAFANHDAKAMAQCYHQTIVFSDPAFGTLTGKDVSAMWQMLIERANGNLKISFSDVEVNGDSGAANWQAEYLFSKTGLSVVNKVRAQFVFKDGLIISHTDQFNFWNWSRQAFGVKGFLLGWTPFFKAKVSQQARKSLQHYIDKL